MQGRRFHCYLNFIVSLSDVVIFMILWRLLFARQDSGVGAIHFVTDGEHEVQNIVGVDEARKLM